MTDDDRPAPAALPDRVAPTVRLRLARSQRLQRRLKIAFTCSEACTTALDLERGRARLARATKRGAASKRATATLTLSKRTLARLRRMRARRVRTALTLKARDAAGNTRTVKRALTLVRR